MDFHLVLLAAALGLPQESAFFCSYPFGWLVSMSLLVVLWFPSLGVFIAGPLLEEAWMICHRSVPSIAGAGL